MVEILEDFEFPGRGRPSYNWTELTDGKPRKFVVGVDFSSKLETFRGAASKAALRAGMKAQSAVVDGGAAVVVQFYVPGEK